MKNKKLVLLLGSAALGTSLIIALGQHNAAQRTKPNSHEVTKAQSQNATAESPAAQPASAPRPAAAKQHLAVQSSGASQKRYYLLDAPNDPYYAASWPLQSVKASAAWNVTTGSTNVVVAVIDSGFALAHEDLAASWHVNAGEYGDGKESDDIDNDGNGYVDDYRGWNFIAGTNTPQAGATNPTGAGVTHGTEVAGLVGAVGNNGVGTTAVSQHVSLMPLQVMDDTGSGYSDAVANALYYAVDNGAQVVNMSLGTSGDDPLVRAAVDYAYDHNVVVVAAAGNCGNVGATGACTGQAQGFITFPASYDRVLAVGATTSTGTRASFSSYGQRLDVMAPGAALPESTSWSSGNQTTKYDSGLNGTSFASPIVASSVALIRAIRPSSTVDDVRALIMAGAAKVGNMSGLFYTPTYGHGLLDVSKAITVAADLNASGEVVPAHFQGGGVLAEHSYDSSDTIGVGCAATSGIWCTAWLRDPATNAERYLPYTKAGVSGKVGWSYNSSSLGIGDWEVRARDGNTVSVAPYLLGRK